MAGGGKGKGTEGEKSEEKSDFRTDFRKKPVTTPNVSQSQGFEKKLKERRGGDGGVAGLGDAAGGGVGGSGGGLGGGVGFMRKAEEGSLRDSWLDSRWVRVFVYQDIR
jgi:hypothetical protein